MSLPWVNSSSTPRFRGIALVFLLTAAVLFPMGSDVAVADDVDLPDLISVPPTRVQAPETVTWGGDTNLVIRFDGHVTNVGEGPLDLFGNPSSGTVAQRARSGDGWVDVTSPQVVYETADGHNHWHLMKVARYSLWNESKTAEVAPGQKVGFCLYDVVSVPGAPVVDPSFYQGSVVRWCEVGNPEATELRMGISAGYQDVYDKSLTYQWVDVSDVQPGVYWVAAQIDPENVVVEANEANNTLAFSQSSVTVPGHVAQAVGPVPVGTSPVTVQLDSVSFGSSDRVFRIVEAPSHGTLNVAVGATIWGDAVVYTPEPGYEGTDSFTYVAADPTSQYPRHPAIAGVSLELGVDLPPSVTISGAPASLIAGTSALLSAAIVNAGVGVDWFVNGVPGGNAEYGTVIGSGLYRAPLVPPPGGAVTIRAQSRDVPAVFDEVTVMIELAPEAPVVIAPSTQQNLVGESVALPIAASDANGDQLVFWAQGLPPGLSIDAAGGLISGEPTIPGTYSVTVYAGDGGLTGSATFAWIIEGVAPSIGDLPDRTVAEGESATVDLGITDPQGLPYICDVFAPSYVTKSGNDQLVIAPGYDDAGSAEVTIEVTNSIGATATASFTVTVENVNRPPILGYLQDETVAEGEERRIPVVASDPDGQVVTVAVGGPPFVSYDPTTSEIVVAPGFDDAGSGNIAVTATDASGGSASQTFLVTVHDVNRAPELAPLPPQKVAEGEIGRTSLAGFDPDGDSLVYAVSGAPFAAVDPVTTELVLAPGFDDAGEVTLTVTVVDEAGASDSHQVLVTVMDVNRAPALAAIANLAMVAGEVTALDLGVHDPDGDEVSITVSGSSFASVVGGSIELRPHSDDEGSHELNVIVTDGRGGSASATFTVSVSVTNHFPALSLPGEITVLEGSELVVSLDGSDIDGHPVSWQMVGPAFVELGSDTGLLTIRPGFADAGVHQVEITVTDPLGLSASAALSVVVVPVNRAPGFSAFPDLVTPTASDVAVPMPAADPDGDDLMFSATGLPPGIDIDPVTGELTGIVLFEAVGLHDVTIVASDGEHTARASFVWEITDEAPQADIAAHVTGRGERVIVELSGRASADPEGGALRYFWDLDGDGRYNDARRWWTTLQGSRGTIEVGLLVIDPAGNRSKTRRVLEIP